MTTITISVPTVFLYYWLFSIVFESIYLLWSILTEVRKTPQNQAVYYSKQLVLTSLKSVLSGMPFWKKVISGFLMVAGISVSFAFLSPILLPVSLSRILKKAIFAKQTEKELTTELVQPQEPSIFDTDEILKTPKNEIEEIQHGWLLTGDGFSLNTGDEYYSVYKNDTFSIKKEYVDRGAAYGSYYYHTRFKHIENAEKFILDCQNKKYNQWQIKHACIHSEIEMDKIEKMYSFLTERAI